MKNLSLNHSLKVGFSFGITSGVITTLGLLVGLAASTESSLVVLGGILTIAIADASSDAMGIHMSEESEGKHTPSEIWQSTLAAFFAKFFLALTFIIPVLLLEIRAAIAASVIWGVLLVGIISFFVAKKGKIKPWKAIAEHLFIALLVVAVAYSVGLFISSYLQ